MDINQLINIVKIKIIDSNYIENIEVEDKTFLHKKHQSFKKDKFHLKLIIRSEKLKKKNKLEATRIIYNILDDEMKNYIHSIQILFK